MLKINIPKASFGRFVLLSVVNPHKSIGLPYSRKEQLNEISIVELTGIV